MKPKQAYNDGKIVPIQLLINSLDLYELLNNVRKFFALLHNICSLKCNNKKSIYAVEINRKKSNCFWYRLDVSLLLLLLIIIQ